jgi:signal transduction histidine kinase
VVRPETGDLVHLVRQLADEFQPRVPAGVRLRWSTPDDGAASMLVDRAKLKTIVRNLVGNALKFTEAGTVHVRIRAERERVVVVVEDTGIGIAPAEQTAIFEMFHRVDASSTRRSDGIGLGLHVVARLVRLLGGRVAVESTPGQGSRFTVELPVVREAAQARHDAAPA